MALNKECKREIVAVVILNVAYVLILSLLRWLGLFDMWGIKPDIQTALWLFAGVSIFASISSVTTSYHMLYKRKHRR